MPPVPEDCIRELAYLKWEKAGKPPGDGSEFWFQAEAELFEYAGRAGRPPRLRVPGYEILKRLGAGGQGVVYLARQEKLGRHVALKLIKEDEAGQTEDREKERKALRREAELLATLNNPNVVTVHEVGETGGDTYLCMEYLERGSLADDLAERRKRGDWPSIDETAEMVQTLAEALDAVHRKGVVHRDVKPGNLLLGERQPNGKHLLKISDFGLARFIIRPPRPRGQDCRRT